MRKKKKESRRAVKSEYLNAPPFERIKNYYLGKISRSHLTKSEHELMWRIENIWNLYRKHLKTSVTIKYHIASCKAADIEISDRTAWRDFKKAQKLWGQVLSINRQAKLILLDEMATDLYQTAKKKNQVSQMNKAVSNLIRINKQVAEYDQDHREPHTYELHLHIKGEKRILDLNKLPVNSKGYNAIMEQVEEEEMDTETFAKLLDEDS